MRTSFGNRASSVSKIQNNDSGPCGLGFLFENTLYSLYVRAFRFEIAFPYERFVYEFSLAESVIREFHEVFFFPPPF
jgi:hypothetical protein